MYGYVYVTTNLITGKIYVGQHKSEVFDDKYYGSGVILKQSILKYGIDNFKCEMLQCYESKSELEDGEIYWISKLNSTDINVGYNRSYGGFTPRYHGVNHPMYGKHHSELSKVKNSLSHVGRHHTEVTIEKIREANKGKKMADESKMKISKSNKGKPYCGLTEDGRRRISEANKNKVMSIDTRQKISNSNKNRKFSLEHKKKLKLSHIGKPGYWENKSRDDATKLKISESLKDKPRFYRRIVYKVGDKIFNGLDEGADYFGVTKSCISLWIKSGKTRSGEVIEVIVDNQLHRKS